MKIEIKTGTLPTSPVAELEFKWGENNEIIMQTTTNE